MDGSTTTTMCDAQLCRICINSHTNSMQMISIFGEDSLWQKITTLADVKIEKNDTLPQQVCVTCAKNAISACLFKKKCEESDNFYRQQLLIKKIEGRQNINPNGVIMITDPTMKRTTEQTQSDKEHKQQQQQLREQQQTPSRGSASDSKSGSSSNSSSNSSSSSSDDDDEEDEEDEVGNNAHSNISNEKNVHKSDIRQLQDQRSQIDLTNNAFAIHSVECESMTSDKNMNAINHRTQLVDHNMATEINDDEVDIDEGEIKEDTNGKEPFDLNSIRLMQQYMQHHMSKFNSNNNNVSDELSNGCGSDADDDEPLPLIPEIELITPSDEQLTMATNGIASGSGMDQQREFQCPSCYQVFEMKQILKAHMQSVHGAPGPVYECTNCRKTYFYKRFLEKHIRRGRCVKKRRNQTRPMQCSDCHVLFPTGHHLGWHKRTGCPSRASNMPLQQLFKQNMTQFNNFPKRVGARKPDNGVYMNQRKVIMTNKRKGRARIKLDAKKISLAKQLILREATTTVIANELNISRTFAWRLRKSLVNGVSLHERVDDQNTANDDDQQLHDDRESVAAQFQAQVRNNKNPLQRSDKDNNVQCEHNETIIKEEPLNSEDDEPTLTIADDVVTDIGAEETAGYIDEVDDIDGLLHNDYDNCENLEGVGGLHDNVKIPQSPGGNQMSYEAAASPHSDDGKDVLTEPDRDNLAYQQQQQQLLLEAQPFPHIVNARQLLQHKQLQQQSAVNNTVDRNGVGMSLLTTFPTGVAATLNQLPVNLSIRPIPNLTNNESNSSSSSATNSQKPTKKPRKPNVFIDDEKYAMAKLLVGENASTMEIARALNVSQMTAWKVRDAIIKGVPLSYRNKRDTHKSNNVITMVDNTNRALRTNAVEMLAVQKVQQRAVINDQQLQLQQHLKRQQQIQQQQQHQQQLQQLQHQQIEMLKQQHQQQLQQQGQQQKQQQQQIIQQQQQPRLRQHATGSIEKSLYHSHQQQQQQQKQQPQTQSSLSRQQQQLSPNTNVGITKMLHPRRRLKAAEREQRDKQVTREILELIKEDSNIQYWKVSARLADKGIAISPSSVCQKLKSMGIHRRWKPGDKPPMVDIAHLKVASAVAAAAVTVSNGGVGINSNGLSADEGYEQRFDLGGAHFLSAFTR